MSGAPAIRKAGRLNPLILGAIGVSAIATAVLVALPGSLLAWQVGSWTLAIALLALLVLVLASGYALATSRTARRRRDVACFMLGFACLAAIAVGSM